MKNYLHILLDSREASVSFARSYYSQKNLDLGVVEHIRVDATPMRLRVLLKKLKTGDEILISVHFLSAAHLKELAEIISGSIESIPLIIASYDSFTHVLEWCDRMGVTFLPIRFKKRLSPRKEGVRDPKTQTVALTRVWIQYRLMLAIISRSEILGNECRDIILTKPAKDSTLEKEYARALRFFDLNEPDMAGGSYSCEAEPSLNEIDKLRLKINKVATTEFSVLISGESGTGKETIAWAIHEFSPSSQP